MVTTQQTTDKSFRASVNGKALEIFISEKEVKQDATASVVPKGHREIAPEEGAQMWNRNEEFREDLYQNGAVWTNQKVLKDHGYQKINPDGTFSNITEEEYDKLKQKDRAYKYSGDSLVALDCYWDWGLDVAASVRSGGRRRVAYTSLGEAEPQKSASSATAGLLRKAQEELEALRNSNIIKPEAIEAIARIVEEKAKG